MTIWLQIAETGPCIMLQRQKSMTKQTKSNPVLLQIAI